MISNANIFLEENDKYSFKPLDRNSDTIIFKFSDGTWITGTWDAFNKLFHTIDEMLHEEKETYISLQDRLSEVETKADKLQEENDYLRTKLSIRRQA
ncbi:hypothetical protein [Clostridium pasteurianum]|uniref:Uncharacterized protein n=1 Tax=Clostridium pasteurianum BC1 TaxID=86416 RepID=R4KCD4_CLOPA|nr:hypothetical protein [Clostridium pasteurianum]AGK98189.1 hypothetical protein Clopa_3394 [Clostridium pasteurianum BC1]